MFYLKSRLAAHIEHLGRQGFDVEPLGRTGHAGGHFSQGGQLVGLRLGQRHGAGHLGGDLAAPGRQHAQERFDDAGQREQPAVLRQNAGEGMPIEAIENALGKKAIRNYMDLQPGDVPATYADVDDLIKDVGFKPDTSIEEGIGRFVEWYKKYYRI